MHDDVTDETGAACTKRSTVERGLNRRCRLGEGGRSYKRYSGGKVGLLRPWHLNRWL